MSKKEQRPRHYKLVGRVAVACSLEEWATSFGADTRHVADTYNEKTGIRISTVFLGLDHQFGDGPPLIFETMIFGLDGDEYQARCSTWDEAEKQHLEAMQYVRYVTS